MDITKDKEKCSLKKHENIDAITFCQECHSFMCNKCGNHHSELFQNHNIFKLDKNIKKFFTGFCKIENHINKLEYYCKDHQQLCCLACISKIKGRGNGQHSDCDICHIEDIKEEKRVKLSENIKCLEELSKSLEESNNYIKNISEEVNKKKDAIKLNIQKTFTKIRTALNEREDQLLLEVDKTYEQLYFSEEFINKCNKLPKNTLITLERVKQINQDWEEENKLNLLIDSCLDIEININDINAVNETIEKTKAIKTNIYFTPDTLENDVFLKKVKNFGKINCDKEINILINCEIIMKELKRKEEKIINKLENLEKNKSKMDEILKIKEKEYYKLKEELDQVISKKKEERRKQEEEEERIRRQKEEEERLKKEEEERKKKEEEERLKKEEEERLKKEEIRKRKKKHL